MARKMIRTMLTIFLLDALLVISASQDSNESTAPAHSGSNIEPSSAIENRLKALDEIARLAQKSEAVEGLTLALNDSSPEIRGFAARKLGALGQDAAAAVPVLLSRLDDKEYRARWISSHFATQRAVRYDIAEALGQIGPDAYAGKQPLNTMAQHDNDPEVRVSAALALLRIAPDDDGPLQKLVSSLKDDKDGTRGPVCAAKALGLLGSRAKPAFDAVVVATQHSDESVRINAIDAVVSIDPDNAVEVLRRSLKDEDVQVRESASEALGTVGAAAAPAVKDLIWALSDDSDALSFYVRASAAKTLGLIGPAAVEATPTLERLAEDPKDKDLQTIALKSLRQIREQPANKTLNPSCR